MNILFWGDVVGGAGRKALQTLIKPLRKKYNIDIVIINGENAAGGFGLTLDISTSLFNMGVNIITSGNHIWDKKEIVQLLEIEKNLLRPANYPPSVPGKGSLIYEYKDLKIGVINLAGRVFMPAIDCPFRTADKEIENIKKITPLIIVDMHGEATSEKVALGWYLDGRVSAVVGTHTHVQTADERILPKGTAYITDIGMTGSMDSVIGMKTELAISKFLTSMPIKFETAKENIRGCGVFLSIDDYTGKAIAIERFQMNVE